MAWKIFERLVRHPKPKLPAEPSASRRIITDPAARQRDRNERQGAAPGRTRLPASLQGNQPDGPDAA